jgi:hypothetical protein
VGHDPRRVPGDLPQAAQRLGLALQAAHVVEILERAQRRGRMEAEAARSEAEQSTLAGREQAGQSRAQTRAHALASAQDGLVDAGAEGGYARQARLTRQTDAHRLAHGAIDGGLGLAAEEVDDEGAHVVAGRVA